MGNSLRCCLACMVPCGALDVVRIVHLSGHVDEFSCPVAAASVLAANPNHTLTTAWSPTGAPGCASKKLVIVSPDSELKRGRIYFLIPSATLPADRRSKKQGGSKKSGGGGCGTPTRHVRSKSEGSVVVSDRQLGLAGGGASPPEKAPAKKRTAAQQHRRRMSTGSHAAPWQPHLACIAEDL